MGTLPWPVMKMIGMSGRSLAMRFCSSRPVTPGRDTSSTRQLGATLRGRARKSWAHAKVSTSQPSVSINRSRDSRTETSSSTTNTIGLTFDIRPDSTARPELRGESILHLRNGPKLPHGSILFDRKIQGRKQSCVAERLVQTFHCTLLECLPTNTLVPVGRNEYR